MTYYTEREFQLIIENTDNLYNAALEVTDFERENNQISNLMAATMRQIRANTGEEFPKLYTDHEVREIKDWVASIVHNIQSEAKEV